LGVTPVDYRVQHVHRPAGAAGGGLPLVYRDTIAVNVHPLAGSVQYSTFELQLVRIGSLSVAKIYRPPFGSSGRFFEEIEAFLSMFISQSSGRLLLRGDFNCCEFCGKRNDVIDTFSKQQHVTLPARGDSLSDLIISDANTIVTEVSVNDGSFVSEYRLVTCKVRADGVIRPAFDTVKRHNLAKINRTEFEKNPMFLYSVYKSTAS
jgi:hypothetical protein